MQAWEKGSNTEAEFTKIFHSSGMPLLVSSLVLRSRACGQIDCAKIEFHQQTKRINLTEVKSNSWVSKSQQVRLLAAADFLSKIFSCSCRINFALGQNGIAKNQNPH